MRASQVVLVVKNPPANVGDLRDSSSIPGLRRSQGGGHGNPLQYSCLGNPMDRGAWRAIVHGVAKSWTWLRWLSITHKQQYFRDGYRWTSEMASRVPCLLEFMAFYNQSPPLECWPSLQTLEWVEYSKDGGHYCQDQVTKMVASVLLALSYSLWLLLLLLCGELHCKELMQQEYAWGSFGGASTMILDFLDYSMRAVEKAMAPHSSTLAWKIPWMEEPGGLQSMGSLRVRHDWANSL